MLFKYDPAAGSASKLLVQEGFPQKMAAAEGQQIMMHICQMLEPCVHEVCMHAPNPSL